MVNKRVYFEPENRDTYLDIYVADPLKDFTRKAILVIPGGGYGEVCAEREGEPIGMAFMPYGYNAFVLHYSVGPQKRFPTQLIEASLAMKHIRDHAQEYNIDPEKIFVTGFSAGGHLAGCLGTMWGKEEIYQAVDMPYGYNKPTGMMLIYPVVTGVTEYSHALSFRNLLGVDMPEEEQLAACSIEQNVTEMSVPLFIVHTSNDQIVDVRNSLCLAEKYREKGINFEMHIYPDGPHGVALGNEITKCGVEKYKNTAIAKWVENAVEWAERI
ncbi:MAG: alpha/beta hydrolase [Lachnospiraceae bacterium]|nr:alpha/beta hydrolase [Lachnospiraceae bacterium]